MTTKEYISKETVLNILHDDYNETYFDEAIKNIESLPTFSPEKIIEEMIEELEGLQPENWKLAKKDILQEALSRIHAENIS